MLTEKKIKPMSQNWGRRQGWGEITENKTCTEKRSLPNSDERRTDTLSAAGVERTQVGAPSGGFIAKLQRHWALEALGSCWTEDHTIRFIGMGDYKGQSGHYIYWTTSCFMYEGWGCLHLHTNAYTDLYQLRRSECIIYLNTKKMWSNSTWLSSFQ